MNWTQQDLDNYHAAMRKMKTPTKSQKRQPLNEKVFSNLTINEGLKSRGGALNTIFGQTPSKSNSYRIAHNRLFKTKQVTDYEKSFLIQCKERGRNIQGEFELHMDVYCRRKSQDIDNFCKVVLDCMQTAKVFKNDNQCVHLNIRKFIDKTNPRIEYKIIEK